MKISKYTSFALGCLFALGSGASFAAPPPVGFGDVLGKIFHSSSGSSISDYAMSISIRTVNRQNIEIGFVHGHTAHTSTDIAFSKNDTKSKVSTVMVNCKEQKYAPEPTDQTNASLKTYLSGKMYKWGDYGDGRIGFVSNFSDGYADLTNLFKTACQYTDQ